jgi:hypothetical protein
MYSLLSNFTTLLSKRKVLSHTLRNISVCAAICAFWIQPATAANPAPKASESISMKPQQWQTVGDKVDVKFISQEGFPDGIILLKSGAVALKGHSFRNGTIEFDIKPLSQDIPGIRFRQHDLLNAEEFYIRSFPDCRAENDCIQYSPVINGFMLWNTYPEYQRRAPVFYNDWNHVRLVVSGKRMNVFINDSEQPTLEVGELLGNAPEGGLEVYGPAAFANLRITPNRTDGLSPIPVPDNVGSAPGIAHVWELGPLTTLHYGATPRYSERPQGALSWKAVRSERFGIVNINRQFTASQAPPALSWLRTFVNSDHDQVKQVSLGWIGEAWVFVNGSPITSGKNFYYPEGERRAPDGRLSLENTSFSVPLHRGHNEIMIALYSSTHDDARSRTQYGWGLALRYDDMRGLTLQH